MLIFLGISKCDHKNICVSTRVRFIYFIALNSSQMKQKTKKSPKKVLVSAPYETMRKLSLNFHPQSREIGVSLVDVYSQSLFKSTQTQSEKGKCSTRRS